MVEQPLRPEEWQMSLRVVRAVSATEHSDDLHVGRLLVLLRASGGRDGLRPVAGIMKLAKMDFLLRYPNCLARVLEATVGRVSDSDIEPHERNTIETKMVRFRYGPWDSRYLRWIGLLIARGLGVAYAQGNTVYVRLTESGRDVADSLGRTPDFQDIRRRSVLTARAVGSMSATGLKAFIYEQFPELLSMRWGEEIDL